MWSCAHPRLENKGGRTKDNPNHSSRWYPGGGIYRNVWLIKTNPIHIGQWGSHITTTNVSKSSATINLEVTIDNDSERGADLEVITHIFKLDSQGRKLGNPVGRFSKVNSRIGSGKSATITGTLSLKKPKLWGPPPTQQPNLYKAVTTLLLNGEPIDEYETRFGIRSVEYNPDKGILVNGAHMLIAMNRVT